MQVNNGGWYRQTDIVNRRTKAKLDKAPVMNRKETPIIDIGHWTTYRIAFSPKTFAESDFENLKKTLSDHGIHISTVENYSTVRGAAPAVWSLLEEEISGTHPHLQSSISQGSAIHELGAGCVNLPFDVRYQLEVCVSNGLLHEHSISRVFLVRLASLSPAKAVYLLEKVMESKH